MKVLVTGGTGYAGRFIVEALLAAGHIVSVSGRSKPQDNFFSGPVDYFSGDLDPANASPALFEGCDGFVHAAFHHVPGKFRGGEGDDPETFRRLNVGGSLALFAAAKQAGVRRAVFLSSRAVYGSQPPGALLSEETEPRPDTLYGEVKLEVERGIAALADETFLPVALRVTGIYGPAGPGRRHKWASLFADFEAGEEIAPRVGTEVHGDDMAAAVRLVLEGDAGAIRAAESLFNVSDLLLDRHDLLADHARLTGCENPLPERADASTYNAMDCARLKALGWEPKGRLDLSGLTWAFIALPGGPDDDLLATDHHGKRAMQENNLRLTDPAAPSPERLREWLGKSGHTYWTRAAAMIDGNYPGIFAPEWLNGGNKHGWSLRYKKSKSFCTFIPEKGRFLILLVFGKAERDKVETVRGQLSAETLVTYDEAKTYHDGKWVVLAVDSDTVLADLAVLFAVKRKARPHA